MKITLQKIEKISGKECCFYNVLFEDGRTLYNEFLNDHLKDFGKELNEITMKMKAMGRIGAKDNFLKLFEGNFGDGVCAIADKKQKLRLYCIRFGESIIILGYGGPKPGGGPYQKYPILPEAADTMKTVSKLISDTLNDRDHTLCINSHGNFEGSLIIENNDYE